jgi:hypothetical protein
MRIHIHTNIDLFIYLSTHLLVLFENKTHGSLYKRGPSRELYDTTTIGNELQIWNVESQTVNVEKQVSFHILVLKEPSVTSAQPTNCGIRSLTFNFPNSQLIIEVPNCQQI